MVVYTAGFLCVWSTFFGGGPFVDLRVHPSVYVNRYIVEAINDVMHKHTQKYLKYLAVGTAASTTVASLMKSKRP